MSDFNTKLIELLDLIASYTEVFRLDKFTVDKLFKELRELNEQEIDNKRSFILYSVLYQILEKQDPENVASRIDYLTGKDYSDICELYKIAKNIKQHDKELVAKVLENIRDKFIHILNINDGHFDYATLDYEFNLALDQIQQKIEYEQTRITEKIPRNYNGNKR